MAHVGDYLESGSRGHGRSWRDWARKVGCRPTTLYDRPVSYRARRRDEVTRVPPLPASLQQFQGASAAPKNFFGTFGIGLGVGGSDTV